MLLDSKKFNEITNSLVNNLEREIFIKIKENAVPEIKEIILRNYETLSLYRMHKNSKLHLNNFYDILEELLDEYLYIEIDSGSINLHVPDVVDIEKAKAPELKVLLVIIEGLAGRYVELTAEEAHNLGLSLSTAVTFVIKHKSIYLYRRSAALEKSMKTAGISIKKWPFSKPEDIFEEADTFVNDNISKWLEYSVEKAKRELIQEYK